MDYRHLLSLNIVFLTYILGANAICKYNEDAGNIDPRINKLAGQRYVATDEQYTYYIGICTPAIDNHILPDIGDVGVMQANNSNKFDKHIVGKISSALLMKGTDWLLLEYGDGENYHTHCGNEKRRARLMITCDRSVSVGEEVVKVFEEANDKETECYYLFEMASSAVCPGLVTVSLSVGTILLIVLFSVTFLYLLLGFLYNRFVLGAKGKDQIPNYEFWQDCGNLEADGCDLVCRTKRRQDRSYKGVGDDQLQDEDDRDEHLLPM